MASNLSVLLRSPRATITGPWGSVSADEIEVSAAINTHTTATFTAFTGTEAGKGASVVLDSDAAQLMGRAQTVGFSQRSSPDTTIQLDDGGDGKADLEMFMTAPAFMMNSRTLRPSFSAVAGSAMMNNLKLDIYTTDTGRKDGIESNTSWGEATQLLEDSAKKSNLADRLYELTQTMISYWQDNKGPAGSSTELKTQRDTINAEPLRLWYELLNNSTADLASTSSWMETLVADSAGMNRSINALLLGILRGATRDFQETVNTLCDTFQMVVVPDPTGRPGRLALMRDLLESDPVDLELPAASMLLNGNSSGSLLPVQQVLIRGLPLGIHDTSVSPYYKTGDSEGYYIGGFPAETPSASGEVVILPLPAYLQQYVLRVKEGQKGITAPDLSNFGNNFSKVKTLTDEYTSEVAQKVITDYARAQYIDLALGGTSTSISMPADVTLWPGTRYRIVNSDKKELFVGFLSSVSHSFSKSAGTGRAFTTCNFTHILFPGFTLPGV